MRSYLLWMPLLAWAAAAAAWASDAVVPGLDHVPLAVSDLAKARADYEALGFAIKPGRPHANGIENAHVKFPDGTEVELITARQGMDALSSDYLNWLKDGEGPAFLGLFAPNLGALKERLSSSGFSLKQRDGLWMLGREPALQRVFFASRQRSPTDRPAHFAHANTAFSLSGVWLAGADAEQALVRALGGVASTRKACDNLGPVEEVQTLPEAELFFLPAASQLRPGRSIVALRISVGDLEAVQRILDAKRIQYTSPAGCEEPGLWVAPAAAHGVWLEFHQRNAR